MTDNTKWLNYDDAIIFTKDAVNKALSESPQVVRKYTSHLASSKGKFIRAISLITCAQNSDGLISSDAVKIAAAIEMLHLATLVHDDIIDNADIRRGIVTLQKKHGPKTAVICGDYLFCAALKLAMSVDNKKEYINFEIPDYITKVCLGELYEHINNNNIDLGFYNYLKIISGKTAALFEASFYLGALLAVDNKEHLKKYQKLGKYIGIIFQLTDDCMDFESTKDFAKKPTLLDFEQGVITLPIIYTFSKLSDFKQKARQGKLDKDELKNTVINAGGIKYTKKISKKYYNKAVKIINDLNLNDEKRNKMYRVLNKAYRIE